MASSGTTLAREATGLRELLFQSVTPMSSARLPEMEIRRIFAADQVTP